MQINNFGNIFDGTCIYHNDPARGYYLVDAEVKWPIERCVAAIIDTGFKITQIVLSHKLNRFLDDSKYL